MSKITLAGSFDRFNEAHRQFCDAVNRDLATAIEAHARLIRAASIRDLPRQSLAYHLSKARDRRP